MRLTVTVLGRRVLEISTEPDAPQGPRLEATSGGQFEFGFTESRRAIVECRGDER